MGLPVFTRRFYRTGFHPAFTADQGEALAQFKLASLYESGRDGVPKNLPKAAAFYRKAAEQGRADAQYNLGMMYESGHGIEKDPAEAARWFKAFNENQ